MRAFNTDKDLKDVIDSLINDPSLLELEPHVRAKGQVHKLRGELRKYLNRPVFYSQHIQYLKDVIKDIEDMHPEIKN